MPMQTKEIDRGVAVQVLVAGIVATVLCFFTAQLGFVSAIAFVLAPSLVLLGIAGSIDPRILQAGCKKQGESVKHLPKWIRITAIVCWTPSFLVLAYLLLSSLARFGR